MLINLNLEQMILRIDVVDLSVQYFVSHIIAQLRHLRQAVDFFDPLVSFIILLLPAGNELPLLISEAPGHPL